MVEDGSSDTGDYALIYASPSGGSVAVHRARRGTEQLAYEDELACWDADHGFDVRLLQEGEGGRKTLDAERGPVERPWSEAQALEYKQMADANRPANRLHNHVQNAIGKTRENEREVEVYVLVGQPVALEAGSDAVARALIANDRTNLIRSVTVLLRTAAGFASETLTPTQLIDHHERFSFGF